MAKGQVAKAEILKKIMETFDGAFLYNDGKEIRIPMTEDGIDVQIKVALTCAKENVEPGDDNKLPGTTTVTTKAEDTVFHFDGGTTPEEIKPIEPTAEEKANVKSLLEALGL